MSGSHAVHQALDAALSGAVDGVSGDVHLLGEALELSPATRGLLGRHPERVHLLPAADATLVGVGLGLAMAGGTAVVELADASALQAALPQLVEAGALHGSEHRLRLVVRVPVGPDDAVTALVAALPDSVAVASPGTPAETGPLLRAAMRWGGPVVLLEPRSVLAGRRAGVDADLDLGQARLLREGAHATVLALGAGVDAALDAADALEADGISVDVVDLRSLRPLDAGLVARRVHETGRPVVVGPVDRVLLAAVEHAFLRLESPPATAPVDAQRIAEAVRASVRY